MKMINARKEKSPTGKRETRQAQFARNLNRREKAYSGKIGMSDKPTSRSRNEQHELFHRFRMNCEFFELAVLVQFVIKSLDRNTQVVSSLSFITTKVRQCFQDIALL